MPVVEDGANSDAYYRTKPRVMHLLMNPADQNPSLPKFVQQKMGEIIETGSRFKQSLFYRLARRSYTALHGALPHGASDAKLAEALLSVAIVNLAYDVQGTHPGNLQEWAQDSEKYKHWHGQIDCLKPELVICGGTFEAAKNAIAQMKNAELEEDEGGEGSYRYFKDSGAVFLKTAYPGPRLHEQEDKNLDKIVAIVQRFFFPK